MSGKLTSLIEALKVVDLILEDIILRDKEAQPQYRDIFEYKYIFARDHKYIYASIPGAFKLGLRPKDIVGRHWSELQIPKENMEPVEEALEQVFCSGFSIKKEIITDYHTAHGLQFFEYSLSPIFDDNGQVEAVLCVLRDISQQKQNKEQYVRIVEKLGQIIDALPIPLIEVDKAGIIRRLNTAFCQQVTGLSKQDTLGRHYTGLACLFPPALISLNESLRGKHSYQKYLKSRKINWLISSIPLYDKGGLINGAVGIYEDITEHEKERAYSEHMLNELLSKYLHENAKFSQLIEVCAAGILIVDSQGKIEAMNQAYRQRVLNGLDSQDLIGKHGSVLAKYTGIEWEQTITYQALQGLTPHEKSIRINQYSLLVSGTPIKDEEQRIIGALNLVYDITEHENLLEQMKKMDRLNIIGEMAAGLAHEIRNPMTVAKGYLQRFKYKCHEDCPMRDNLDLVLDELKQVENIVTDFLSLAKNKATSKQYKDLNDIIRAIEPLISSNAVENGHKIQLKLEAPQAILYLDEQEIKQLIINMARNAIEAMNKPGILTLRTILQTEAVLFEVEDTGTGIPTENLDKIFNPFYTSKETGTGLGLSICASIVERHSGKITVRSKPDHGTCFSLIFPQKRQL